MRNLKQEVRRIVQEELKRKTHRLKEDFYFDDEEGYTYSLNVDLIDGNFKAANEGTSQEWATEAMYILKKYKDSIKAWTFVKIKHPVGKQLIRHYNISPQYKSMPPHVALKKLIDDYKNDSYYN